MKFSLPFYILQLLKSLPSHKRSARKRYPLRAEPPRIGNYRKYLPPTPGTLSNPCPGQNPRQLSKWSLSLTRLSPAHQPPSSPRSARRQRIWSSKDGGHKLSVCLILVAVVNYWPADNLSLKISLTKTEYWHTREIRSNYGLRLWFWSRNSHSFGRDGSSCVGDLSYNRWWKGFEIGDKR